MKQNLQQIKKAKSGDTDAFAELYGSIYLDLYRFALYTLKNPADAEDAVSETVMDAFVSIRKLRSAESFKAWIFKILLLEDEERLIISMHIFAGYTSKEIAKILHMNANTIRSKESRALKKLSAQLNNQ